MVPSGSCTVFMSLRAVGMGALDTHPALGLAVSNTSVLVTAGEVPFPPRPPKSMILVEPLGGPGNSTPAGRPFNEMWLASVDQLVVAGSKSTVRELSVANILPFGSMYWWG